jgi:hypothetical protein
MLIDVITRRQSGKSGRSFYQPKAGIRRAPQGTMGEASICAAKRAGCFRIILKSDDVGLMQGWHASQFAALRNCRVQ